MRCFAVLLVAGALWGAEDAREIVRRAVEANRAAENLARSYTFIERQDARELDGDNRPKRHEIKTFDVTLSEGSPYRRLIARNDQPLSPEEERIEREKLEQSIVQRRNETPEDRAKRLADWEKRRRKEREFLEELPAAFDFRLLGEERIEGRDSWVIEAVPRPAYRPHDFSTRFLTKVKGKLWIDKAAYAFVNIQAEVVDTVTMGAILVRIHKGTRFAVEQTHVNGEVWLPRRIHLSGSARIALIKRIAGNLEYTYRDFRKFSADSHVVTYESP